MNPRIATLFATLSIAVFSLALVTSGCKKAEKKRRGDTPAATAPAPTPPAPSAAKPMPGTNPHASPTNPHGGAANPHGGAANPHGGAANPHGGAANPHGGAGKLARPLGAPGAAAAVQPTAADGTKVLGPFSIKVPKGWKENPPSGSMRLAQWEIGTADKGELVLFSFPGGGGVDANINRWVGQFSQEDGSSSKDKAVRKDLKIDGLDVTTLSVHGRFVAAMTPGAAAKHNKANYKMLAAIISVGGKAYFFKMTGPKKTLDGVEKDWDKMVAGIKKI